MKKRKTVSNRFFISLLLTGVIFSYQFAGGDYVNNNADEWEIYSHSKQVNLYLF